VAAALEARGHDVVLMDPAASSWNDLPPRTDIILPMLHGTGAEDGTLQRQLDALGVPWVGSSAAASELTFDKVATRAALCAAGLPVPPGLGISASEDVAAVLTSAERLGWPVVVKPSRQGSSVGVSIVRSARELPAAWSEARKWDSEVVLEQYIAGREVTVPFVDGLALPVIEILPARAWYDYDAKYNDDATSYRVSPSGLPEGITGLVRRAIEVCGVSAISRTDLRVDRQGRCWILEINTIPGMTSHSLVPLAARAAGWSLGELCEQVLWRRLQAVARDVSQRPAA
jgi:D-alanine-D-alanine ligase